MITHMGPETHTGLTNIRPPQEDTLQIRVAAHRDLKHWHQSIYYMHHSHMLCMWPSSPRSSTATVCHQVDVFSSNIRVQTSITPRIFTFCWSTVCFRHVEHKMMLTAESVKRCMIRLSNYTEGMLEEDLVGMCHGQYKQFWPAPWKWPGRINCDNSARQRRILWDNITDKHHLAYHCGISVTSPQKTLPFSWRHRQMLDLLAYLYFSAIDLRSQINQCKWFSIGNLCLISTAGCPRWFQLSASYTPTVNDFHNMREC